MLERMVCQPVNFTFYAHCQEFLSNIRQFLKKTGSQKTASDLVVIMTTHAFAVILLVSEGSEQFKEHCGISWTGLSLNTTQSFDTMPSCMAQSSGLN
jgi:hypothetical protein